MAIQIEYYTDYLSYLYPEFDYFFDLNYSSGHNYERPNGLSVTAINLGWGGKERNMRDSVLIKDDIGNSLHGKALK